MLGNAQFCHYENLYVEAHGPLVIIIFFSFILFLVERFVFVVKELFSFLLFIALFYVQTSYSE